ncbi:MULTISPECIES: tail fiber protein [unclassified Halomonas]|uniref:phage tail protein n=1 Tax=unclassified Halomonas TaxID=2609666 RepID=UPI002076810E|nr:MULTISPECIES: tail fiber protein [unclassified Halomonas]
MNFFSPALSLSILGMAVFSSPANATCSSEPYMGSICLTAASYCPDQYLEARGQLMSIAQNTALFSLLGTTYGGDGRQTFGLPDLQGRTPVGLGNGPGLSPVAAGQTRGTETTTLMSANLAPHTHAATVTNTQLPVSSNNSNNSSAPGSANPYLAASGGGPGSATIWSETLTSPFPVSVEGGQVQVGSTGQAVPFSNLPPQQGIRYCVAINGLYSPRP